MKKFVITMSLATTLLGGFAIGYHAHENRQEAEVQEVKPQRAVEYEVASIEGDTYLGTSNEFDEYGTMKGLKFTAQQVGKRLNIGDKVTGVWRGSELVMVIAK